MASKNAVALNPNIDKLLNELVTQRRFDGSLIDNKVKIIADLIMKAHKKECK
jgi:hypothetical protein